MPMKEGDIIYLDYEGWIKESNELFDTTIEKVAKDNDKYQEEGSYQPIPVILGTNSLIKGLEEDVMKAEVGKKGEVEIPPAEAYGDRDAKLVEIHSLNEIRRLPEFKDGETWPDVGMDIQLKGKTGRIAMITASRVRVDFNHPLAGKTLLYKYKVTEKISKKEDKAKAVLKADFGTDEGFEIKLKEKKADITLPDVCKYDQRWMLAKFKVVGDLREHLGLEVINFIESYEEKKEEAKEEKKASDKKDENGKSEKKDAGKEEKAKDEPKKEDTGKEEKAKDEPKKEDAGKEEKAKDEPKKEDNGKEEKKTEKDEKEDKKKTSTKKKSNSAKKEEK